MAKKKGTNFVKRSIARGTHSRGLHNKISDQGADAWNVRKKSTKGSYYIKFTKVYQSVSEKDIELKEKYAKDLLSDELVTPVEFIKLKRKGKDKQTLTALDSVHYVVIGSITVGKVSIRVQRLWKGINLIIIYQQRGQAIKPVKKGVGSIQPYKKKTKSQIADQANKADRKRRDSGKA
jgi:hypothetical protein